MWNIMWLLTYLRILMLPCVTKLKTEEEGFFKHELQQRRKIK